MVGWEEKKLLDVCDFVKTRTDDYSNYVSTDSILPNNGGITVSGSNPSGRVIRYLVGDVLVSNIRPYLRKIWFATYSGGCSADVLVFRAKDNCKTEYLHKILSSDRFFDYATFTAIGTKMPRGDKNAIMDYELLLPQSSLEQQAISATLSDVDNYIAALERLIAKKRNIKQGAMQVLLKPKDEWEEVLLEDVLNYEQPYRYIVSSGKYDTSGIPVLTAGKTFVLGYTHETEGVFRSVPIILFDDFLAISRYIDFPFKIKSSAVKMLSLKRPQDNLRIIYELMQLLKYDVANHQRHWISMYSKLMIRLPIPNEQKRIAKIFSDMDAEIDALIIQLNKARLIKQGMMQALLTGQIRILIPEMSATYDQPTTIAPLPTNKSKSIVAASQKPHNAQFDDAVALAAIVDNFYHPKYSLGRVKMYKLLYLLRRYQEAELAGFEKKAAGPYKVEARYAGGEKIAKENSYIVEIRGKDGSSFSRGANIAAVLQYVEKWQWQGAVQWLVSNFKYNNKRDLETLATVDMAAYELRKAGNPVNLQSVKTFISGNAEWSPKLNKEHFSDAKIIEAIEWSIKLFGQEVPCRV